MKCAYIDFLNHCYIDTEVEMKEIYTSSHMWTLFDSFLVDSVSVSSSVLDRSHADKVSTGQYKISQHSNPFLFSFMILRLVTGFF